MRANRCPVHNYFKEVHGEYINIGNQFIDRHNGLIRDMPIWVHNFIDTIDEAPFMFVRAVNALEVLEGKYDEKYN